MTLDHTIREFSGYYRFLSNFYVAPFEVDVGFGLRLYKTVEHAFQAAKSSTKDGHDLIVAAATPTHAKRMGRKVILRNDWEQIREEIMYRCVKAKFEQNAGLKHLLVYSTGSRDLVEGNTWGDVTWGMVWNPNEARWEGQNLLGKILMQVRAELVA